MNAVGLVKFLGSFQFPLSDEKRLQAEMAVQFEKAAIRFSREVRLGEGDIIDFMVGSIGIEVKIKGRKIDIYRQIERYCGHQVITSLVLATNVAMGMPAEVSGKPVFVVNLGRAWI